MPESKTTTTHNGTNVTLTVDRWSHLCIFDITQKYELRHLYTEEIESTALQSLIWVLKADQSRSVLTLSHGE